MGLGEFKALRRKDNIGQWMAEVPGLMVMAWCLTRTTFGRAGIVLSGVTPYKPGARVEAVAQGESSIGKCTRHQGITTRKGNPGEMEDGTGIGGEHELRGEVILAA